MKGGKQIAYGSYGCIFNPQLLCKGQSVRGDGVSKLMDLEEALKELKEQTIVDSIDSEFTYHLRPPKMCDIGDLDPEEDALNECHLIKDINDYSDFVILQMENGGVSIDAYLSNVTRTPSLRNVEHAKRFILGMENLFEGLVQFYDNDFIHFDLKTANIVYKEDENRFNMIDFGLSSSYKDINSLYKRRNFMFEAGYFITPMELWFIPNGPSSITNKSGLRDYYKGSWYEETNKRIATNDIYLEPLLDTIHSYSTTYNYNSTNLLPVYKEMVASVDTYSLGIVLVEILVSFSNKKFTYGGSEDIRHPFYRDVARLINEMIEPAYMKRISPVDALEEFRDIKRKYTTHMPPGVGAAAAASGSGSDSISKKKTRKSKKKYRNKSHIKRGGRKNKKRTNRRRK